MSELVITVRIQLPDGAAVSVSDGTSSPRAGAVSGTPTASSSTPVPAAQSSEEPPWPDMTEAAEEIFKPLIGTCPVHHKTWKTVPAGVSKKTGKPYSSFLACPEQGCDLRPNRAA